MSGVAHLPVQVHEFEKNSIRMLNILLMGEGGVGKTSVIRSLLRRNDTFTDETGISNENGFLRVRREHIVEKYVRLIINLIDCPEGSRSISKRESFENLVSYAKEKAKEYINLMSSNLRPIRDPLCDTRVHVCLFFLSPHQNKLSSLDIESIKSIGPNVKSIYILISKVDMRTEVELTRLRRVLNDQISNIDGLNIPVYASSPRKTVVELETVFFPLHLHKILDPIIA